MRFASDDVRDHIVCRKNDYEPSYALYGASLRWKGPKIDFREIFGVDRFSTFATQSYWKRTSSSTPGTNAALGTDPGGPRRATSFGLRQAPRL